MWIEKLDHNLDLNDETLQYLDDESFKELMGFMQERPEEFPDMKGDQEKIEKDLESLAHKEEGEMAYATNEFWEKELSLEAYTESETSATTLKNNIQIS